MNPKISVGVPVYNGARYLERALASLAGQDFDSFEVVICDNASTDETPEICKAYAARDPRFKYHRNPENIGAAPNYNRVFELSQGECFKWACYDDECYPSMLRKCWSALASAGPEVTLAYPHCELIDETGAVIGHSPDHIASPSISAHVRLGKVLLRVGTGHAMYGLIRRSALARTRLIQSVISNDYIMLGELAMLGPIIEIDDVLFRMRIHAESTRTKYKNLQDLAVWFDPRNITKRQWLPEVLTLVRDHVVSAFGLPLSLPQRVLCGLTAPSVIGYRRTRNFLGRQKAHARALLRNPLSQKA